MWLLDSNFFVRGLFGSQWLQEQNKNEEKPMRRGKGDISRGGQDTYYMKIEDGVTKYENVGQDVGKGKKSDKHMMH